MPDCPGLRALQLTLQLKSAARNLFLGREPLSGLPLLNWLDKKRMDSEARKLLKEVGITKDIDPNTPISALSGGERQSIAIARPKKTNIEEVEKVITGLLDTLPQSAPL